MAPRSLLEKIWDDHLILEEEGECLLMVGRHLGHDGSYNGFNLLDEHGLALRHPDQFFATPDHGVSTLSHRLEDIADATQRRVVETLQHNADRHRFTHFGLEDSRQGIIHVVGPEQGITQPGLLLVCGDSHTSTHGALGALAFGVGASDVGHVLATQAIWRKRPKSMRIAVEGIRPAGVTAKDVILAIIAHIGANGAAQHVIEYAGAAIRAMSIEERLTVCNMSIEAGGRAGMVAPDETAYAYLKGRPFTPQGADWDAALAYWRSLPSDPDARFDTEVTLDAGAMAPMVTWGNSPENALPVTGRVPDPKDATSALQRDAILEALDYMGLTPGQALTDITVDQVFIGSCTNSRLSDLREAAAVARLGRARVPAMISPGSGIVKQQAEAEGLDRIFREAGFEWRESGCSMCVGMNGDLVAAGKRCASTSNRNFRGRQGKDSRTHLLSPAMAAAAALTGRITDVRELLRELADMEPFTTLTGIAAPLDRPNVDTDQIAPARFLRRPRKEGYADVLFHDLRFSAPGVERPDFILNRAAFRGAKILVADRNFGGGSSREQAVWSLVDHGIRCVMAVSFGDIFWENSIKGGLLLIRLDEATAAAWRSALLAAPGTTMSIDLATQTMGAPDGSSAEFDVEPARKRRLLHGLDDIGVTLTHAAAIGAAEEGYRARRPWLFRHATGAS